MQSNLYGGVANVTNVVNYGNVSVTAQYGEASGGGIIGISNTELTIMNAVNSGNITTVADGGYLALAGGIIGTASTYTTVSDAINTGDICGRIAGGIAGRFTMGASLKNCINTGKIYSTLTDEHTYLFLAGIAASAGIDSTAVENAYSLTDGNGDINGETCSIDDLNSKDFYTGVLGWSENVWKIDGLDIEAGIIPILK